MKDYYDYLIIGADAAGNSAAGQIRMNDPHGSIGILERGNVIAYGACGLPYALGGRVSSFDNLVHYSPEGFGHKTDADVITGAEVTGLDRSARKVTVQRKVEGDQVEVGYGKLMIGTGAQTVRLPFIDYSSEKVFEIKTVPGSARLKQFINDHKPQKAAIIGSGYIGLEAAENFRELGLDVEIFEAGSRPVPKMPGIISQAVESIFEEKGIHFSSEVRVTGVDTTGDGVLIETDKGTHEADLLLSAVGVKPATDFLAESGLEMDRGAIVVDRYCQTSDKNIWSGGDCSTVYHRILKKNIYLPLGHTANKQGRIAGMNMSGKSIAFPGVVGTVIFKFYDSACAKTGLSLEEARDAGFDVESAMTTRSSRAGYCPKSGKVSVELVYEKGSGTILGAALAGAMDSYGLIDAAAVMVQAGMTVQEAGWFDMAYAPPFAPVWNALVSAAGKATLKV